MSRFRQQLKYLGKSGLAFISFLLLFLIFYFTKNVGLALLSGIILIPLTAIVLFRTLRFIQLHALWSVRNRLLFVYGLLGILPLLLIVALVGLGAWAFTTELAVYLATSALDRRIDGIHNVARALDSMTSVQRLS